MRKAKRKIASHVANSREEFLTVLDHVERLTHFVDADGSQIGLRNCVVHQGKRFEELAPEKQIQDAIFDRLEYYIGKTISDLVSMSDEPWSSVQAFRERRTWQGTTSPRLTPASG